jgi:hypothetical protein
MAQLALEVGVPLVIWVTFIGIGVGVQYASHNQLKKKALREEWPKLDNLQTDMGVVVASHHPQAEEAQSLSNSIDQVKGRLGWTPGQDFLNVGKGTLGAVAVLGIEAITAVMLVALCFAAGGGGGDCCCVGGGGGGDCNCCSGGSSQNARNRLQPPVGPANWETVLGRRSNAGQNAA